MVARGLTLVETIVATSLLALVLLALLNLLPASLASMRRAEHQLRAEQIAQEHLEKVRELPFEKLALGPFNPAPAVETAGGVRFTPALEIYALPGSDPNLLRRLRVSVTWEFQGRHHQMSQETYRAHVRRP